MAQFNHILVWKTTALPWQANKVMRSWPSNRKVITITDIECDSMANKFNCDGYFRKELMNITRADICKYMATWMYGGVYSDLDISIQMPFNTSCNDLCVSTHDGAGGKGFASHFFGAARRSPCLYRTISSVCYNAKRTYMNFKKDPHVVHNIAGPNAFYKAARACASVRWFEPDKVPYRHHVASASWHGQNYNGWIYERMQRAGWKRVYQHR